MLRGNRILVFSDTHFPYEDKGTLSFLEKVSKELMPDLIVHGGDLCDVYSISMYPKDLNHPDSWTDEIKKARAKTKKLAKIFPVLHVVESNHDDRAYKKAHLSGVPREFLVPYKDVMGAPDAWEWHRDLTIKIPATGEEIFIAHTKTGGAFINAKDLQKTTVLGHQHTKFGITGFRASNRIVYGVDTGCLISDEGAPYSYNKNTRGKAIRGCVFIENGVPRLLPKD